MHSHPHPAPAAPAADNALFHNVAHDPHRHRHGGKSDERRKLVLASILCAVFMIVEVVGGYLAGSLAIMTDAAHLLSDLAGFVISLLAISLARLPADASMTYGFARAEIIGALISVLFIWALAGVLMVFAVYRLLVPEDVNGKLMFLLGAIGLTVNLVMGTVLGHGHSHAHGHHHDDHGDGNVQNHCRRSANGVPNHAHGSEESQHDSHTTYGSVPTHINGDIEYGVIESNPAGFFSFINVLLGQNIRSVNVRAAYLHVLGDLLQNVGVLIAAAVIWWRPSWRFADPLCTLLFSVIVISTSYKLVGETLNVLMEGTPPSLRLVDLHDCLANIDGIDSVGDLHAWSLTTNQPSLSVHVSTGTPENHCLLKEIETILRRRFGISHTTIQINCARDECCDDLLDKAEEGSNRCFRKNSIKIS